MTIKHYIFDYRNKKYFINLNSFINNLYIYISFVALLLIACANPQLPSGGPKDPTPPKVIECYPDNATLNFKDDYASIKFNKYMNKQKVIENVYVLPNVKTICDWSGKELTIKFDEPLDTNTTYALTLGTDYTDYFDQNSPESAFTLIFSTGSKLDSGTIRGKVYDENPAGTYIFAYYLENINPDTLNPAHTKPYYKTQCGTNGSFEIKALKKGRYMVFAIRDANKDDVYDLLADCYGTPQFLPDVAFDSTLFLKFKLRTPIDNLPPLLFNIEPKSNKIFTLEFSKPLDTNSVTNKSFILKDSATGKIIPISATYMNIHSAQQVDLISSVALDTVTKWQIIAIHDSIYGIRDTISNLMPDTSNSLCFHSVRDIDTTMPVIIKSSFSDSITNVMKDQNYSIMFNLPPVRDDFKNRIKFTKMSDSSAVDFDIKWNSGNYFTLIPQKELIGDSWFDIKIKLDSMKFYNDRSIKDTILNIHFKTFDFRNYGGASGTLIDSSNSVGKFYVNFISKSSRKVYSSVVDEKGNWEILNLPEGLYKVEVFCDTDNDGKYYYGSIFPFKLSEKFNFVTKEINIKPRWKNEDIKLIFK